MGSEEKLIHELTVATSTQMHFSSSVIDYSICYFWKEYFGKYIRTQISGSSSARGLFSNNKTIYNFFYCVITTFTEQLNLYHIFVSVCEVEES